MTEIPFRIETSPRRDDTRRAIASGWLSRSPTDPAVSPRRATQAMPGGPGPSNPPEGPGGKTPPGTARAADSAIPGGSSPGGTDQSQGVPAGGLVSGTAPGRASPSVSSLEARPGQEAIAAAMSEDRGPDSLDAHIRRLLKDLNLRGYHTHDARRSPSGFPDWTIVGPRGLLFRELKREGKNPTPAQREWLDDLAAVGQDAGVWRPSDLLSGRVQREMTAISYLHGAVA